MMTRAGVVIALALVACEATNFAEPPAVEDGEIVFASNRGGRDFELYRIAVDGSSLRRLTQDEGANAYSSSLIAATSRPFSSALLTATRKNSGPSP